MDEILPDLIVRDLKKVYSTILGPKIKSTYCILLEQLLCSADIKVLYLLLPFLNDPYLEGVLIFDFTKI